MAKLIALPDPIPTWVFDHNTAPKDWLAQAAIAAGGATQMIEAIKEYDVGRALAELSRRQQGSHALFVHIDDDGFDQLQTGCGPGAIVVRCSTVMNGFSSIPRGSAPLLLKLRKPLRADFDRDAFTSVHQLLVRDNCQSLRHGHVSAALWPYFRFRRPDHVAALLVLLQGVELAATLGKSEPASSQWWWSGLSPSTTDPSDRDRAIRKICVELEAELGCALGELSKKAPAVASLLTAMNEAGANMGSLPFAKIKDELRLFV